MVKQLKKAEEKPQYKTGDKVLVVEKTTVARDGKFMDLHKRRKGVIVNVDTELGKTEKEKGSYAVRVGKKVAYVGLICLETRRDINRVEKTATRIKEKLSEEEVKQLVATLQ